jgi:hypothetical protein
MEKKFECLRCGWCCEVPDIDLESRGIKPPHQSCEFLLPVRIKEGVFLLAKCTLDGEKPFECRSFEPSDGVCEIGRKRWRDYQRKNTDIQLPREIKEKLET